MTDHIIMISATDAARARQYGRQIFAAQLRATRRAAVERAAHRVVPCREVAEGYAVGVLIGLATGACWGLALVLRGLGG